MSMHYLIARDGYEFQITDIGMNVLSIKDKFVDRPQQYYKKQVPSPWVTHGYVEEVRIEQDEVMRNVSIWK